MGKIIQEETREALPRNVVPQHYSIHISVSEDFENFTGTEEVELLVKEESRAITCNIVELTVSSASVLVGGNEVSSTDIQEDKETEQLTITFPNNFEKDSKLILKLVFNAPLNATMAGFYKSKCTYEGKSLNIGTTQFEAVDARRAFPCWDEPSLKATFSIALTVPKDCTALCNMPAIKTEENGDFKTVTFDKTPIMSTYIVAYSVGHFECVEGALKNGSPFRVWTTPGKKAQGQFALEVGIKILQFYEDYFEIPYPLPKTDMIALPDFNAGAMENWGLITYRETALLCDPVTATVSSKSYITEVVAHELAHQWFGNLVTMEWWKELWLNEGFASFIATLSANHFFPEWKYWTQFISDNIFPALDADSQRTSHPIEVEINKARETDEIFDEISYSKGASVLKMVWAYLGEENFRKGLNLYLNRFTYKNAITTDLWKALSDVSGKDVEAAMRAWVTEMGYPVVNVEETDNPDVFKVSQRRFLKVGLPTEDEDKVLWNINIGYISAENKEVQYFMLSEKSSLVSLPGTSAWMKLNASQGGLYRVLYSPALLTKLHKALDDKVLSVEDRLGLINDSFALSLSGSSPLYQTLELVLRLADESDPLVWNCIIDNLHTVVDILETTESTPYLDKYALKAFSQIGARLGWDAVEGEDDLCKTVRPRVLTMLGLHGDQGVIAEAQKRFQVLKENPVAFPADIAMVALRFYVRSGGHEEHQHVMDLYDSYRQSSTISADLLGKSLLALGLSCNPEVIDKTLSFLLTSDTVRAQDFYRPWAGCASGSRIGKELTWKFLQTNWDDILKKVGGLMFNYVMRSALSNFSSFEKAKELEEFLTPKINDENKRNIANCLEQVNSNATTQQHHGEKTLEWLKTIV